MPRVSGAPPRKAAPPPPPAAAATPAAAAFPELPAIDPNAPFDPMAFLGFTSLDESNEFTRALLFGDAGSGKTSCAAFVANLPGDGITVFVDVEGGLKKDALRKLGVDTSKIAIWPDREKGEEVNYDTLEQLLFRLRATLRARPGSIKATVFDSTTEVSGGLLVDITTYAFERDQALTPEQRAKRLADDKKLRNSKLETQIQDYGLLTSQGRNLFRGFRDLGCHLVLTALEKNDAENEQGAKIAIGPELPNKLSGSIRGYVDLSLRLTSETIKTGPFQQETLVSAETKLSLTRLCKDRDGVLPMELLNPTFDRIRAYVTGEMTEATDPEIARHQKIRETAEKYRLSRKPQRAA